MEKKWESIDLHEHPAQHQAGRFGRVVLSAAGVYCLQVGGTIMSCPQDWAAAIQAGEGDVKTKIKKVIELLESTKSAFKSKTVEEAREMLESIINQ